jgi:hypothetical protein
MKEGGGSTPQSVGRWIGSIPIRLMGAWRQLHYGVAVLSILDLKRNIS